MGELEEEEPFETQPRYGTSGRTNIGIVGAPPIGDSMLLDDGDNSGSAGSIFLGDKWITHARSGKRWLAQAPLGLPPGSYTDAQGVATGPPSTESTIIITIPGATPGCTKDVVVPTPSADLHMADPISSIRFCYPKHWKSKDTRFRVQATFQSFLNPDEVANEDEVRAVAHKWLAREEAHARADGQSSTDDSDVRNVFDSQVVDAGATTAPMDVGVVVKQKMGIARWRKKPRLSQGESRIQIPATGVEVVDKPVMHSAAEMDGTVLIVTMPGTTAENMLQKNIRVPPNTLPIKTLTFAYPGKWDILGYSRQDIWAAKDIVALYNKQDEQEMNAAVRLQASARGRSGRNLAYSAAVDKAEAGRAAAEAAAAAELAAQTAAAVKLQALVRGRSGRDLALKAAKAKADAERTAAAAAAAAEEAAKTQAAVKLQAMIRGRSDRKTVSQITQAKAREKRAAEAKAEAERAAAAALSQKFQSLSEADLKAMLEEQEQMRVNIESLTNRTNSLVAVTPATRLQDLGIKKTGPFELDMSSSLAAGTTLEIKLPGREQKVRVTIPTDAKAGGVLRFFASDVSNEACDVRVSAPQEEEAPKRPSPSSPSKGPSAMKGLVNMTIVEESKEGPSTSGTTELDESEEETKTADTNTKGTKRTFLGRFRGGNKSVKAQPVDVDLTSSPMEDRHVHDDLTREDQQMQF